MRPVVHFFDKLEDRVRGFFSRRPIWYAFVAGVGLVLFWRGVWHSADALMEYFVSWRSNCPSTDLSYLLDSCSRGSIFFPLDGLISLAVGSMLMLMSGVFVSELLGKEIIISGLRGEKKLAERTEVEVRTETGAIAQIQHDMRGLMRRLAAIEKKLDGGSGAPAAHPAAPPKPSGKTEGK